MLGLFSDTERRVALDVAREVLKNYPAHLAKIELLLRNPIGGFRPVANERTNPAIQQLFILTNSIASQLCADPLQAENEKRKAWAILIEEWFKETQRCTYQPAPIPAPISSTGANRSNSLTIADIEQMGAFNPDENAADEREKMDALLVQQFRATSNDIAKMKAHDSTPRAVRWMEEHASLIHEANSQSDTRSRHGVDYPESKELRQARRWQLCLDAGLKMPADTYSHFPRGIGKIAKELGITRQALAEDLNEHRELIFGR